MVSSPFHRFQNEYESMRKVERDRAKKVREHTLVQQFMRSGSTERRDDIRREARGKKRENPRRVVSPEQAKKIRSDLTAAISQIGRFAPHQPTPSLQVRKLFAKSLDYTSGTPNPVYLLDTMTGQPTTNVFETFVEALADPVNGEISLALVGGNNFDLIGQVAHSAPMPERWLLGDALTISGSLFYLHDVVPSAQPAGTVLNVSTAFYSPNEDLNPYPPTVFSNPNDPLNGIFQCIDVEPGQPDSYGSGYVSATANLAVTVTLFGNQGILATNGEYLPIFYDTETRTVPGGPTDPVNVLSDEWLLAKPHQTRWLGVTLPFESIDIRQVLVEAEVGIGGYRMGIDDPDAGGIALAFLNAGPLLSANFPFSPTCPFIVANMDGYIYGPKI